MEDLAAIVLAAGYSSRMGSFKPLLELGGRTFLKRAVGAFSGAAIDDIAVVVGHRGDEVGAAAARLGARVVWNPRFASGMYSSVQAGVAALRPAVQRFFLLPVDCPLVRPETVGRLARVGESLNVDVVMPAVANVPGHPPLLSAALRAAILAAQPPGGLRALLDHHAGSTAVLEVADRGVITDADTAGDVDRLLEAARGEDLPSEERCYEVLRGRAAAGALVAHSRAVAAVAAALATALNERGQRLCLPLVVAAALLHDVAREQPRHAEAGAVFIEELGYARVAALVRQHMDGGAAGPVSDVGEADVVFLADKLVLGDRIVTLEERFDARQRHLTGDPAALAAAASREASAAALQRRVEEVLGRRFVPEMLTRLALARRLRGAG